METENDELMTLISNLKSQLDDAPRNADIAVNLGNIFYDNQDPAQAIVYYRIALDINPKQPGVLTDMGTMYWQIQSVAMAEQAYRKVIADYPGFGNAYLNLGYLLLHAKNQLTEARAVWTALIKDWPNDSAASKIRELLLETMN